MTPGGLCRLKPAGGSLSPRQGRQPGCAAAQTCCHIAGGGLAAPIQGSRQHAGNMAEALVKPADAARAIPRGPTAVGPLRHGQETYANPFLAWPAGRIVQLCPGQALLPGAIWGKGPTKGRGKKRPVALAHNGANGNNKQRPAGQQPFGGPGRHVWPCKTGRAEPPNGMASGKGPAASPWGRGRQTSKAHCFLRCRAGLSAPAPPRRPRLGRRPAWARAASGISGCRPVCARPPRAACRGPAPAAWPRPDSSRRPLCLAR